MQLTFFKQLSHHAYRVTGAWFFFVLICLFIVFRTEFKTDMSAFLPTHPTVEQQLLIDQLQHGPAARTLLLGIEADGSQKKLDRQVAQLELANTSISLARFLRKNKHFSLVMNGENIGTEKDQKMFYQYRYHLSPRIDEERFSVSGLKLSIENTFSDLAMSGGLISKDLFFSDPTGELMFLLENISTAKGPNSKHGVWFSRDGSRAIMLLQTAHAGSDIDAQQNAIHTIKHAFEKTQMGLLQKQTLLLTGAPLFAMESRRDIEADAARFSTVGSLLIILLLLWVYRSPKLLFLGAMPVLTGALAGWASVAVAFGQIHGITVGFGITLIGEAIDYAIYYFVQNSQFNSEEFKSKNFWKTIRLGVLTSVCGFSALLFSGFSGLAQLGTFSIAGLLVAAIIARYCLPIWGGKNSIKFIQNISVSSRLVSGLSSIQRPTKYIIYLLACLSIVILFVRWDKTWQTQLSALSPISTEAKIIDEKLRNDIFGPQMSSTLIAKFEHQAGVDPQQHALKLAEEIEPVLNQLVQSGKILGYESPSKLLPSVSMQEKRVESIPSSDILSTNLSRAAFQLQMRPEIFKKFIDDSENAKKLPPLSIEAIKDTALGAGLANLISSEQTYTFVYIPLHLSEIQNTQIDQIKDYLKHNNMNQFNLLDIGKQSRDLYDQYLKRAISMSLLGLLAICVLLRLALKKWSLTWRVIAPQIASIILLTAALVLMGVALTILHLIGLLLVVAVGSNYGLFFSQSDTQAISSGVWQSLVLANLTTMIGFGILSFAQVPVLQAFGITVGPGVVIALVLSALFAPPIASRVVNNA